eukprot:c24242_g1_i1 orf=83-691(+)
MDQRVVQVLSMEEVAVSLHRSNAHKLQVEAWEADQTAFQTLQDDQEAELRRVQGEAYQVAFFYASFQTVILSSVSQANLLNCALWWSPVSLSIVVCAAACLAIADKIHSRGELKEEIKETKSYLEALQVQLDLVSGQGDAFNLETAQPQQVHRKEDLAGLRSIASRDGISALLFLIGFSVLIVCFCSKVLCRHCSPCSETEL